VIQNTDDLKSNSKLFFELGGEFIIDILIIPILSPLFWFDFGRDIFAVICW